MTTKRPSAITPTNVTSQSKLDFDVGLGRYNVSDGLVSGLAEYERLEALVQNSNACQLPGVQIRYDNFIPCMYRTAVLPGNYAVIQQDMNHK